MKTELVLEIILLALNNTAKLTALYQQALAEKRDLTPDEVAQTSAHAALVNEALLAEINA